MTRRFHAGDQSAIQPTWPLLEPFVLWDTRSWDGSTGVGTGGIPNEGTGGSVFDLDVHQDETSFGKRTRAWQGASTIGGQSINSPAHNWPDVGGDPCDGGPITMIVAVGSMQFDQTPRGQAYMSFELRQTEFGTAYFQARCNMNVDGNDDPGGGNWLSVGADYGGIEYPYALYGTSGVDPGGGAVLYRERLIVITLDQCDGGASYWRGGGPTDPAHPVSPRFDFIGPAPPDWDGEVFNVLDTDAGCDLGGAADPDITGEYRFCEIGLDYRFDDVAAGEAWNGLIGLALFRGEPTVADIEYWNDYFFTGYVPYESPLAYTGGQAIRVDATYVYHVFTSSGSGLAPIPGVTLPSTIDLFIVAGGGEGEDAITTDPAGGGGGGEAITVLGQAAPVSAVTMNIGSGGAGLNPDGTNSVYDPGGANIVAVRGRAGGVTPGDGGLNGSFAGGLNNGSAGGGGAGAGGPGQTAPSTTQGGDGGPGVINNWRTGVNELYGLGGGGAGPSASVTPGSPGWVTPNFGGGGTGSGYPTQSERQGRQGIIIARYLRVV